MCAGVPMPYDAPAYYPLRLPDRHTPSFATTCQMRYENERLEGLTFNLDDDEIVGCHLVDCRIFFGGKQLPIFANNCSENCNFRFSESALVTIELLRRMLHIPQLHDLVLVELGLLPNEAPTLH
jgi:hypothetical protein